MSVGQHWPSSRTRLTIIFEVCIERPGPGDRAKCLQQTSETICNELLVQLLSKSTNNHNSFFACHPLSAHSLNIYIYRYINISLKALQERDRIGQSRQTSWLQHETSLPKVLMRMSFELCLLLQVELPPSRTIWNLYIAKIV